MQSTRQIDGAGPGPKERVGTFDDLKAKGYLSGKVGSTPVCVFLSDGEAYAVDDRCPHMGFPLHRGTVENGLLTCHWHHARFDLVSGGTLDPFADDVRRTGSRSRTVRSSWYCAPKPTRPAATCGGWRKAWNRA